ncbi:cysteine-rich receptor-like protein kinase 10 [Beta vulgaris subsp. vulgaris]|uniref:cysteine-rich receptor-like protein kinase 10 n=1 Tax=Beta vulgaris subsp. vulgaris TaxID=3555 RepID=UPI0020367803|nr:cysteine-rich receptor-like protein kinase 10 [Beta vulgaris subsp. vulgaris]
MVLSPSHNFQTFCPLLLFFIFSLSITSCSELTRQFWPKFWECDDTKGNFTQNSTYDLNLATAFSNFTSLSSSHLFSNLTIGGSHDDVTDIVYALYDCRNDLTFEKCHGCVEDATRNALDLCYRHPKEGIVIYEECMLRYANRMIFSNMELRPNYTNCAGVKLLLDGGQIEGGVRRNLDSLIDEATSESSSSRNFAVKNGSYIAQREFYFLVQCTPDLSRAQCKECLTDALNFTVESCASDSRLWGQIKRPSCQMRYDVEPFFNVSSDGLIPPTPSPPHISRQPLVAIGKLYFYLFVFIFSLL